MIGMLMAAASASALTAPRIDLGPAAYPQEALRNERSAATMLRVVIAPDGKVIRCDVQEITGDEKLGGAICPMIQSRRHTAAATRDGKPAWGVMNDLMRLFVPDTAMGDHVARLESAPLASFTVNRLPGGANRTLVRLALLLDEEGTVADCGAAPDEKSAALVLAACRSLATFVGNPLTNQAGQPVPYVTNFKVEFVTEQRPVPAP